MITNFERYTENISDKQKAKANALMYYMQSHKGEARAIKSEVLERHFQCADVVVRKMVNYLRTSGKCPMLASTQNGYFIAENSKEIRSHLKSMFERSFRIQAVPMAQCEALGISPESLFLEG